MQEMQEMAEKQSTLGNQLAQNLADKRPSPQRQEVAHHVSNKHDDDSQPVSFDQQAFHRKREVGAVNIATDVEHHEMARKKNNTRLDVGSATMPEGQNSAGLEVSSVKVRREGGVAERTLEKGVKEGVLMKQAPAYGDAMGGHGGNGDRREKVR